MFSPVSVRKFRTPGLRMVVQYCNPQRPRSLLAPNHPALYGLTRYNTVNEILTKQTDRTVEAIVLVIASVRDSHSLNDYNIDR